VTARRGNTARNFLRLLEFRLEFGDVYAAAGNRNRAAIIVVPLTGGKKRSWRYTYSPLTLQLLAEAGQLVMTEVKSIPDYADGSLASLGGELSFYQLSLPGPA